MLRPAVAIIWNELAQLRGEGVNTRSTYQSHLLMLVVDGVEKGISRQDITVISQKCTCSLSMGQPCSEIKGTAVPLYRSQARSVVLEVGRLCVFSYLQFLENHSSVHNFRIPSISINVVLHTPNRSPIQIKTVVVHVIIVVHFAHVETRYCRDSPFQHV